MDELDWATANIGSTILALNSGSSSLKFGLYDPGKGFRTLISGEAEWKGSQSGSLWIEDEKGQVTSDSDSISDQREAVIRISELLANSKLPAPKVIGHRIVHGGVHCRRHVLIDETVLGQLESASLFAPLHVPPALSVLRYAREHFKGTPHVACLDTAFHESLPDVARLFPLPKAFALEGLMRFGFHGLSCESIIRQLGHDLPERLVIAHLGNGASITAVRNGKSIDTTMGLTPTGGVIMGTRCGDLDPGVLLYLMRAKRLGVDELENLVDHQSGLLGISGTSSDMRLLHQVASSNADAKLAIEMFCYSIRKQIGAMAAVLGCIDMLVFTGGIGEHDAEVRQKVCAGLTFLGVMDSSVRVLSSKEGEEIARHAWQIGGLPALEA